MKEFVLPLVFGLLLTFLICFFFRLMDFFQKKRLWATLNLIFQEKLDDEEVLENIPTETLIKYESMEQELPVNVIRGLSKIFSVNYDCFIDNKLPSPDTAEDEAMLKQLARDFTKLKASEKKAVLEMTRIMANA